LLIEWALWLLHKTFYRLEKQGQLKATQRKLEETWPEIRYRLLLGLAGSQTFQPKHPPFLFAAQSEIDSNPAPESSAESDTHSHPVPAPSTFGNSFSAGLSVIGKFFAPTSKTARKTLSEPATAEKPKTQSHLGFPNTSRQFFSNSAPTENPKTQYSSTITDDYDYLFKISLLGDPGVGTSHLRHRFAKNIYSNPCVSCPSDAYAFEVKTIVLNKLRVKLQIWTAEAHSKTETIDHNESPRRYYTSPAKKDERYRQVQDRSRRSNAIIVVFDVTDYKSFENLPQWLKEMDSYSNYTLHTLAATKCDIPETEWAIKKDDIRDFAEENKLNVFFTSAKDNLNVDPLFEYVTHFIIQEEQSKKNEEIIPVIPNYSKRR
jgi:GTPase SAR1 family protein